MALLDCKLNRGVLVVTLLEGHVSGDDLAESLRKELLAAADNYTAARWIIDFKSVTFISSSGIRPLLTLHRKLQASKTRLVLCNLSEDIAEVFRITRLVADPGSPPGPFEAAATMEEALRHYRHHSSRLEKDILVIAFADKELRGEDLAVELSTELLHTFETSSAAKVVLDFSGIEMITTPCMRCLLQLRHAVKERGGRAVICNLRPLVHETLTVTRLIPPNPQTPGLFGYSPDLAGALASLAN